MGIDPPPYEFREDQSFERAKAELGWPDEELEEHLMAIQLSIGRNPYERPWSEALLSNPGIRIAISDATTHSQRAVRVIYRVEDSIIHFMHVEQR